MLDLHVDELTFLPPLPDFRQQLKAVAAHLLRRLPRVEHLLEQFEHLGVAGQVLAKDPIKGMLEPCL